MTLRRSVKKKRLVSIDDARRFLLDTNTHLSDQQVEKLVDFAEHLWTYMIELFLAWKLG
jgi:hypothetical protein